MVATAAPAWGDDDEARLAALLEANHGGEGLDAYIRRVSPRHLPPRHIAPLIELWERTRHERVFACVELPPRHVKTTTGLHALSWRLARDPALTNAFATFGDDFAASRSRIARTLARSGGVRIPRDSSSLHEWRTEQGGGLLAHGYRGEWTGRGIDGVALLDDLYKDRAAAESKAVREGVWEWFTDVLWTRLQPGSSVIAQFTRWHDDDLIGRLLQGKFRGYRFEQIHLPAIAEDDNDILGREIGEALWPEMYPVEELRRIEMSIGAYSWASLYQQRPRPRGSDVFKTPKRFKLAEWAPAGQRLLISADPAATEDTRADYSALFVLAAAGTGADMLVWLLYGWRGQVTVPAFARRLHLVSELFMRAPVVVESVGAFKAVPQMLRELQPGLRIMSAKMGLPDDGTGDPTRASNVAVDKFLRSQPAAAAWNSGRIMLPTDAECVWVPAQRRFVRPAQVRPLRAGVPLGTTWADELLDEADKFTGVSDPEDDQIDALSHGYNELMGIRQPRGQGAQRNRNPFG